MAPVADQPTWRLTDTSSNGTSVDSVMVGKNKQVVLKGGTKIGFSTRYCNSTLEPTLPKCR